MGWETGTNTPNLQPGNTSTGQATLATVGDMPVHQLPPSTKEPTYTTSKGELTISQIKEHLASGALHLSHLGDDVLKLLGLSKKETPVGGQQEGTVAAWGATTKS